MVWLYTLFLSKIDFRSKKNFLPMVDWAPLVLGRRDARLDPDPVPDLDGLAPGEGQGLGQQLHVDVADPVGASLSLPRDLNNHLFIQTLLLVKGVFRNHVRVNPGLSYYIIFVTLYCWQYSKEYCHDIFTMIYVWLKYSVLFCIHIEPNRLTNDWPEH